VSDEKKQQSYLTRVTSERYKKFKGPLRFRWNPHTKSYCMLCTYSYKGGRCNRTAGPSGVCIYHGSRRTPTLPGEVGWRSIKWRNPLFLNSQRKWWDKKLRKIVSLTDAIAKIVVQFERLNDDVTKRLEVLRRADGKEGIVLDKDEMNLLTVWLKSATVIANLQDVDNRGKKMLGQAVTRERLQGLIENLKRFTLIGVDDEKDECEKNLINFMVANAKKLAPGVDPTAFAMLTYSQGPKRAINRYKNKLIAAFEGGKFLGEELKEYQRPSVEKGDEVV